MAGHNKWSQIKHKKAATDSKRSQLFGKLAKRIANEAKKAGGLETPELRRAVEQARQMNMPKENIERAVERGKTGTGDLEGILYEVYGPGGSALLVEAVTDNRNRTSQELRHLLGELGYALATPGSAQWAFTRTSEGMWVAHTTIPLEEEVSAQLTHLIETLQNHDDVQEVYTNRSL